MKDIEKTKTRFKKLYYNKSVFKKLYASCQKKDDRIDILINKDLKDSIRQVAYDNGYNLSHYLNNMIMNEVITFYPEVLENYTRKNRKNY